MCFAFISKMNVEYWIGHIRLGSDTRLGGPTVPSDLSNNLTSSRARIVEMDLG